MIKPLFGVDYFPIMGHDNYELLPERSSVKVSVDYPAGCSSPLVPATDEEAIAAFREMYSPPVAHCVAGIFKIGRLRGETVLKAYEEALTAYLRAGLGDSR